MEIETMGHDTDAEEARLARLEQEVALARFRKLLTTPEARRDAERILTRFGNGSLTHGEFKAMRGSAQQLYKSLHGYRPASESEIRGAERKKERAKAARKAEKLARKRSRR